MKEDLEPLLDTYCGRVLIGEALDKIKYWVTELDILGTYFPDLVWVSNNSLLVQ